ncbi:Gfo/Idh/MocA family protein [Tomitella biformata]|uniref:Gfo/Idh/MocA family protein n=1 Tax=Tomitella biformata TaxID=630403 RepID=UPI0004651C3B|nr:Gfo/Idh/MocA family oxidoreductase [Tomitella biformata]
MAKKIRVGVIGTGWGSLVLTPAFQSVPDYEVVALCARRESSARAAAERLGVPENTTDWRALIAREDIDLIAVCTPTTLHHEQTMAALRAGKHVLCEKPLALDPDQAREMSELAEERGLVCGVNFEGRWLPERLPVWRHVRDGRIGQPYLARVVTNADYWHPTRDLQSEWMYDEAQGGGYLLGMASHDIDFLIALFGPPSAVCADVRTSTPTRTRADGSTLQVTADDTSTLLMRMRDGTTCVISTTAVALQHDSRVLEIFGSEGSITVTGKVQGDATNTSIQWSHADHRGLAPLPLGDREPLGGRPIPNRRAGAAIRALALMLEDWLPAFDGEPSPVPTLRQGWLVSEVVDAARRSSAGAGWVSLP